MQYCIPVSLHYHSRCSKSYRYSIELNLNCKIDNHIIRQPEHPAYCNSQKGIVGKNQRTALQTSKEESRPHTRLWQHSSCADLASSPRIVVLFPTRSASAPDLRALLRQLQLCPDSTGNPHCCCWWRRLLCCCCSRWVAVFMLPRRTKHARRNALSLGTAATARPPAASSRPARRVA